MPSTSNASEQRWNSAHYKQVKISVAPYLAAAFKETCVAAGASMASVLSDFMAGYCERPVNQAPPVDPYATRKLRRRAVEAMISQMELLTLAEERYRDNIPENLQGSARYDEANRCVDAANEAIEYMREIY